MLPRPGPKPPRTSKKPHPFEEFIKGLSITEFAPPSVGGPSNSEVRAKKNEKNKEADVACSSTSRPKVPPGETVSPTEGFGFIDLPDRPLLTIYSHLSQHDQLSLGATNHRMRSLLLKTYAKCLTIFNGDDNPLKFIWKMEYKLADKILDATVVQSSTRQLAYLGHFFQGPLPTATINSLVEAVPPITEVTLILKNISNTDTRQMITLLDLLAPSLVTLKLYINRGHKDFLATLNSMSALKHLSIYGGDSLKSVLMVSPQNATTRLPILRQLESFDLLYNDDPAYLEATLRQYALPNRNLIARIACTTEVSPEFTTRPLDPRLAGYFKRCKTIITAPLPEAFFASFTSLTSLNLEIYPFRRHFLTYRRLLQALVNLEHLVYLGINMVCRPRIMTEDDYEYNAYTKERVFKNFDAELKAFFMDDLTTEVTNFPRLTSTLQMLQLFLFGPPHLPLREILKVEHCFPGLQAIIVNVNGCLDCSTEHEADWGIGWQLYTASELACQRRWTDTVEQLPVPKKQFKPFVNYVYC